MENISKEVESNDIKIDKFFEVAKVIIYSIIGIVVFFIPVTIDNQTKTILHHITYKLQVNYRGLLQLCTIVYITIGVIKSTLSKHKSNLKKIYSYFSIFSIFIVISIFYDKYSIVLLDDNISLILEETILNLITLLPLSAIFMPFILDFGLMDIVEAYCHKLMKKLFNLSGKSVLNIIMYIFNDCFCGYFMTNLLYKKGQIRQREACIILLNFSIASVSISNYIAEELNINKVNFFILSMFILILVNTILCRTYPINKKKKSYYVKTNYKESYFKSDKLINSINKHIQNKEDINILDIGTGSGAITVSLAKYLENAKITSVDISEIALEIGRKNAILNEVDDRITFVKSDLFTNINKEMKFDIIVSNPPYIKREVIDTLDKQVKDFEPYNALEGGIDGLDFYRAITKEAKNFIKEGGTLAYEVGHDQSEDVSKLMKMYGYTNIYTRKDLQQIDRVVIGNIL